MVAFVVVSGLVGCNGGTVDRHALTNDGGDARLDRLRRRVAGGEVARGRTTAFFAREQAESCAIKSANFADAVARERRCRRSSKGAAKARHAATARGRFERLHKHPSDRASARWLRAGSKEFGQLLVSKLLGLALGILAAIGGFVDIGDLVFNVAAGATFGYQLLWVVSSGWSGSSSSRRCAAASPLFRAKRCSTQYASGSASKARWWRSSRRRS